jgi:hypothetical protein
MPTRNVNLIPGKKRRGDAKERQENGRDQQEHAAKLAALRSAIDEGDASGVARGNVFGRVRNTLKLSASR